MSNVVKLDSITLTKLVVLSVDLFERDHGTIPAEVRKQMIATRYEYAYLQNKAFGLWAAISTLHDGGPWYEHIVYPYLDQQLAA